MLKEQIIPTSNKPIEIPEEDPADARNRAVSRETQLLDQMEIFQSNATIVFTGVVFLTISILLLLAMGGF
jgi:hypothetical protein